MAEKRLNYQQLLALMPAGIPDYIVDFLEDFSEGMPALSLESVKAAFVPGFLQANEGRLKPELEAMRAGLGGVHNVQVELIGKELISGYLVKLSYEKATRGVGIIVNIQQSKIENVVCQAKEYNADELKQQMLQMAGK
jgi:hypothetical protein